jgi:hypothetical protein
MEYPARPPHEHESQLVGDAVEICCGRRVDDVVAYVAKKSGGR